VGTALLDLAKYLKLVVAAAVSNRWQDSLRGEADLFFDEREPSSGNVLRRFRPAGFDAAFDPIGGSHVWKTRAFVATHGTLVPFGVSGAVKPGGQRNLAEVVRLGLLLGFAKLWRRPRVEMYAMDQRIKTLRHEIKADLGELIELLATGEIAPRIGARFALQEARQAHELLESRNNMGKIVLVP
jgi:NADPH:quinone reductase-like Zn-dependent oxidoreductase